MKEALKERITDWKTLAIFIAFQVMLTAVIFPIPLLFVDGLRLEYAVKLLFYIPCTYYLLWNLRRIDQRHKAKRKLAK